MFSIRKFEISDTQKLRWSQENLSIRMGLQRAIPLSPQLYFQNSRINNYTLCDYFLTFTISTKSSKLKTLASREKRKQIQAWRLENQKDKMFDMEF